MANQGGSHEQHVKAGQQSHKNSQASGKDMPKAAASKADDRSTGKGKQGGSHEQHVKAGQQSHKNSH